MLRNQNYLDKRTGLYLSVVALAQVDTIKGQATFLIGTSRDAIKNGNVIEKVKIDIEYDRNRNPFEQGYETAKGQKLEKVWSEEKGAIEEILVNQPFYGWQDYIII